MKKTKLLVSIITIIVALGGLISVSYAYWDSLSSRHENDIEVGEGMNLTVSETVAAPEGKTLVPNTAILGVNDINKIELEYDTVLNKESDEPLTLVVTFENVTLGDSNEYSNLVVINITKESETISTTASKVFVTITLNEPSDENTYHAIKNKEITFTLNFSVEKM